MQLALKIKNWSFYLDSKLFYCNGSVLEKNLTESINDKNYHLFQSIAIGDQISLKFVADQPSTILEHFSSIVLAFNVTDSEVSKDKNNTSVKFIFDSVQKCAILPEI